MFCTWLTNFCRKSGMITPYMVHNQICYLACMQKCKLFSDEVKPNWKFRQLVLAELQARTSRSCICEETSRFLQFSWWRGHVSLSQPDNWRLRYCSNGPLKGCLITLDFVLTVNGMKTLWPIMQHTGCLYWFFLKFQTCFLVALNLLFFSL